MAKSDGPKGYAPFSHGDTLGSQLPNRYLEGGTSILTGGYKVGKNK